MTPVKQSNKGFGLMFGIVFLIVEALIWLIGGWIAYWPIAAAALFFALAYIAPSFLMPLNRIWAQFGARLGWVSNHIVLGLFFFGLMTPVGCVMRLFGWDPMALKNRDPGDKGYWSEVRRDAGPETFKDMF